MDTLKELLSNFPPDTQRSLLFDVLKENAKRIGRLEKLKDKLQYDAWYFKDVKKKVKKAEEKEKELVVVREKIQKENDERSEVFEMILNLRRF